MSHGLLPDIPPPPAPDGVAALHVAVRAADGRGDPGAPRSSFAIAVPDGLLARARRGDQAAFEQIYRWFGRPVFTLAMRLCGDRAAASAMLQGAVRQELRG